MYKSGKKWWKLDKDVAKPVKSSQQFGKSGVKMEIVEKATKIC